jgi:hypothetical protein
VKLLLMGSLVTAAVLVGVWRLTLNVDAQDGVQKVRPRQTPLVAVDSSGNGHDGVNQGSPTVGLDGHRGTAYSFDAAGSWIQVPSTPELNPQDADFMFSAWVNFGDAPVPGETYDVIRKGLAFTRTGEFKVEMIPGGYVKCSAKDVDGVEASISYRESNLADGRWHRIGCARTGASWSVLVDGTIGTKKVGLGSIGNSLPLSIGSKYGHEDLPDGRIDEVVLHIASDSGRRVRPSQRIKQLQAVAPVGLWHLDETVS